MSVENPQETTNTSSSNSNGASQSDPRFVFNDLRFTGMIENALRLQRSLLTHTLDKRRDLDHECGYPKTENLTVQDYRKLYDRGGIPNRIVGLWPDESWILNPDLYEDEDPEITTPFEDDFQEIGNSLRGDSWYEDEEGHPIWEYLNRVDILSGIGHYGVLLIGIDDGLPLDQPAKLLPLKKTEGKILNAEGELVSKTTVEGEGSTKTHDLLYIRAFDESLVEILQREQDPSNRRYMQPTMYEITFETLNAPTASMSGTEHDKTEETKKVHWTRVIHVADRIESNEIFAVPRLRPHFNRGMDIEKLLGGSAEMYWRGALPPIFFVTHPELGTDVKIETQGAKDSIEQMINTLQRWGFVPGVTPIQLAPAVSDPSAQIEAQLDAICIGEGCPKRIFLGSERGELASSQDERAWNKRVKRRQYRYVVPRLAAPLIDRLIQLGVLSQPSSYRIKFPDLESLTEAELADVSLKRTQAMAAFIAGDGIQMMSELDYYTEIMKLSQDDAEGIVERAMERIVDVEEDEEIERQREMEDFEEQQRIIGENRPAPASKPGTTGKPF